MTDLNHRLKVGRLTTFFFAFLASTAVVSAAIAPALIHI
jgi:hypothetical protein